MSLTRVTRSRAVVVADKRIEHVWPDRNSPPESSDPRDHIDAFFKAHSSNVASTHLDLPLPSELPAHRDLLRQLALYAARPRQLCDFWKSLPAVERAEETKLVDTDALRTRIVDIMLDPKRRPLSFSKPDFPESELTRERLVAIFSLIDRYFYKPGTLHQGMQQITGGTFDIAVKDTIRNEPNSAAFLDVIEYTYPDKSTPRRFKSVTIVFQRSLWGTKAKNRTVDGVPAQDNKVRALVATMCHECTHVLANLQCDNDSHDQEFSNMNHAIYGHDANKSTSLDTVSACDCDDASPHIHKRH